MNLVTPRLKLRALNPSDFPALREIHGDAIAMSFYGGALSEATTRDWIDRTLSSYEANGFGFWAVELREEARFIGLTGITLQPIDGGSLPEIGYQFRRADWGHGYATEAAIACRDYGFSALNFDRLYSWMLPDHTASRRVAERVGMKLWKQVVNPKSDKLHVVYSISREAQEDSTPRQ